MSVSNDLRASYLDKQKAAAAARATAALLNGAFVPMAKWGRDHWSTLLYIETRCVDHRGVIALEMMRGRDPNYPTRLMGDEMVEMHSDFDCVADMVVAGLVEYLDDPQGRERYRLTDAGWKEAHRLRRERAEWALRDLDNASVADDP